MTIVNLFTRSQHPSLSFLRSRLRRRGVRSAHRAHRVPGARRSLSLSLPNALKKALVALALALLRRYAQHLLDKLCDDLTRNHPPDPPPQN